MRKPKLLEIGVKNEFWGKKHSSYLKKNKLIQAIVPLNCC